jgi:hypothetical protein
MIVRVPLHADRSAAVIDLYEADAALDEAAGEETARAELGSVLLIEAVEALGGVGVLLQIHCHGCGRLHAEGEFVGADARGEFGVTGWRIELVHALEQVEPGTLAVH